MLLRPGKVLAFDDPENPTIIEDFIKAIGATPVKYPYRNECCGAYVALEDKGSAEHQVDRGAEQRHGRGMRRTDHRLSSVHVQPGAKTPPPTSCR